MLLNGLGNDWKMFIRLAGVEEHDIDACIANNWDVKEQAYQSLLKKLKICPSFCWNHVKIIFKLFEKDKLITKLENVIKSNNSGVEDEHGKGLEKNNLETQTLMFFIITKHIASCWKSISRCLGLNEDEITVIQERYRDDPVECAYQVLVELNNKNAFKLDEIESAVIESKEVSIFVLKEDLRHHISSFQEKPIAKDKQCHSVETVWNVTIISHSSDKYIEELKNKVKTFTVLQDKMNEHTITVHRSPTQKKRMHFKDWKEKECNAYIKRYYNDVDFILFNYGSKDDIPNGFKCFIEKNKPSFIIKNYNLFKHFDLLKLADELTFQQKELLKQIKHMDHIGFDPKRNTISFFKISDGKTVHDIRVDIEDSATFVRMFFLLHQRELANKITCLVSFVVVPTKEKKEEISKICDNCELYLITKEEFQNFDKTLWKKIVDTVSSVEKIDVKDENLKKFKYNMSDIFASMATEDGKLIPNLTENTSEQLEHVITLYPQQLEIANFSDKDVDKHVVLKGSYGSGKTIIGRLLVKHLCCDPPNGIKIYYIHCGASSDFTEAMKKYVKPIDKEENVVCLHNTNALESILKEIEQKHTSAEKVHLIFDEVPLDEITEKDILSFIDALNQPPFDETFCYIICQAMSKERSFTNNGDDFKTSFRGQEEMLKENSAFKIKELKRAVRNTLNIDQLVEVGMKHLEDAANEFFFKRRIKNNLEFQGRTSSESSKQEEYQIMQDIQSQNQIKKYVENIPAEEHEEVHEEKHEEEYEEEHEEEYEEEHEEEYEEEQEDYHDEELDSNKKPNLDFSLKNVNPVHVNQEDHVKEYLKSKFEYSKHSGTLHGIEGSKPRLYFPLEKKKENWDQFEEAYLLMQCFKDLLDDSRKSFFDNDENIILIHFENNTPETVVKAIKLYEMMEETKVENHI